MNITTYDIIFCIHSALARINEELLERKVAALV
jgi:hypothetical protein